MPFTASHCRGAHCGDAFSWLLAISLPPGGSASELGDGELVCNAAGLACYCHPHGGTPRRSVAATGAVIRA